MTPKWMKMKKKFGLETLGWKPSLIISIFFDFVKGFTIFTIAKFIINQNPLKMKSIVAFVICLSLFVGHSEAQIKIPGKSTLENEANKKADEGVKSLFGKKKKDKDKKNKDETVDEEQDVNEGTQNEQAPQEEESSGLNWAKFDFVPGSDIIFYDDQVSEENGEFPSRWDIKKGNVENAIFDGQNVIMFRANSEIIPWLEDADRDYLPDVFTLEFDCYFATDWTYQNYHIYFYDTKNQKYISGLPNATIYWNRVVLGDFSSFYPDISNSASTKEEIWRHVSVAFNKRSMKIYLDDTRLVNVPNLGQNPTGITISATTHKDKYSYIKNIRLAEGGVKLYDKFQQDGKIIASGIRFDVGKATIRPESMGIINEICEMLGNYPDIKLSVEGHTDSDGDADFNKELSEKRAEAVMELMVNKGIDKSRLTSKGFGESNPISSNDSAEGKANNRRVEFVKAE
jgi:outer membrane protein OmpA-like peptidoglycan-associated protein